VSENLTIEETVVGVVRKFCPGLRVDKNSTLLGDLKLLSDDATAIILQLERRFKIRAPRDEWSKVSTVQDVINVFERHIAKK
jgi:acyl carrier protein